MCFHDKPTRNDKPGCGWGDVEFRAPEIAGDDKLIYDECGRCSPQVNGTGSTDYHSHHFRLVAQKFGPYALLVRHGGGDERIDLGHGYTRIKELLKPMDSDSRYLMLHLLYSTHQDAEQAAIDRTASRYRQAFIEGRLRKRKVRDREEVKVWIVEKPLTV